ncbi:phage holin family protein [Hymenobacter sp. BT18]|uniref:bacteriophage holin n=1 Tax=Hymenobacter sp. BT18 TaxID=2835648 RepID=UPI00143E5A51|nr:bacteriophage holin [Hymenobacter sp. BT18]QIX60873.1 phage holin family protein [Hymenobacter sp. BT18]
MRAFFHPAVILLTSARTLDAFLTGLALSPLALLVRQYLFDDWQFLGFLFTLIMVDTGTGLLRSWRQRNVSSRAFSRIFLKVIIYLAMLVLSHIMTHFTVHGEQNVIFKWFDTFVYSVMMAREALSLLENLAAIEPTLIPKALLKRLALFAEDPDAGMRELKATATEAAAADAEPPAPAPEPTPATIS